jgi:hypothetical protein
MSLLDTLRHYFKPETSEQAIQRALANRDREWNKIVNNSYKNYITRVFPKSVASAIRREPLSHMDILYASRYEWVLSPEKVEAFQLFLEDKPHVAEFSGPGYLDDESSLVIYFFVEDKSWFARRAVMLNEMHKKEIS